MESTFAYMSLIQISGQKNDILERGRKENYVWSILRIVYLTLNTNVLQ